jgi:hypothetical protein
MAQVYLPKNATLRTVASELTEEYVRRVLERMWDYERHVGDIKVSIGLALHQRGFPDYYFHAVMEIETGERMFCDAYSGKTHREIPEERAWQRPWSDENMTLKEVGSLLGELRKAKRG